MEEEQTTRRTTNKTLVVVVVATVDRVDREDTTGHQVSVPETTSVIPLLFATELVLFPKPTQARAVPGVTAEDEEVPLFVNATAERWSWEVVVGLAPTTTAKNLLPKPVLVLLEEALSSSRWRR